MIDLLRLEVLGSTDPFLKKNLRESYDRLKNRGSFIWRVGLKPDKKLQHERRNSG